MSASVASDGNSLLHHPRPEVFLLLENPSKSNNLGSVLRCASAFGITTVVAIGYAQCSVEGSHGASKHVRIVNFPVGSQALTFLRAECGCHTVVGLLPPLPDGYNNAQGYPVYVTNDGKLVFHPSEPIQQQKQQPLKQRSIPLENFTFSTTGNLCIAVSKERHGFPRSLGELCDAFVHIPHSSFYSDAALLDLPSCLSIVLHEFTSQHPAAYPERTHNAQKFDVVRQYRQKPTDETIIKKRQDERTAERRKWADEVEQVGGIAACIFDSVEQARGEEDY